MSAQLQYNLFDLDAGIKARDAGIERVIANNESFVKTMKAIARLLCHRRGFVNSDDLREVASEYGIEPSHQNAWGAVFAGAEFECIGFCKSKIPSNHSRKIFTWKLA